MKPSRIKIKWSVMGALFGYFLFHPLIHLISVFHFTHGHSYAPNLASEILQAFSVSMLPWGLAFLILNAFIGLFWAKIRLADAEKSKIIADLREAIAN